MNDKVSLFACILSTAIFIMIFGASAWTAYDLVMHGASLWSWLSIAPSIAYGVLSYWFWQAHKKEIT